MIALTLIKNSDPRLRHWMERHYSEPDGFVGRNICYVVKSAGICYGAIVGGSAVGHLTGRDEFFGITVSSKPQMLQRIVNNTFCHFERVDERYPCRNFTRRVLELFRAQVSADWHSKYGEYPIGFETLVELPRSGLMYVRDGWSEVGITKGFTCKRTAGKGSDSWTGKRVWNTHDLRPKRILCRRLNETTVVPSLIAGQPSLFHTNL